MRRQLPFALLLLLVLPVAVVFAWQDGLATVGDDSASYLILARHLASGGKEGLLAPWVPFQSHFAPLFPALLALLGGSADFARAHAVVAVLAVVALVPVHRMAVRRLGSEAAGFGLVLLFLLMPTAWISLKGILSESMYLAVSMATLLQFDRRIGRSKPAIASLLVFGVLLACVYLTRAIGITLVFAYAAHLAVRAIVERRQALRLFLPFAPFVLLVGIWLLWRPGAGEDQYHKTFSLLVDAWTRHPLATMSASANYLLGGWIMSFTADADVSAPARVVLAVVALAALAGTIGNVLRNRLDGWYVLASLALVFAWVFEEENMRRLLYPLMPLLLIHAGEFVLALCRRAGLDQQRAKVLLATAAFPAFLCIPAMLLVFEKSRDTGPLVAGSRYAAADITDYYTTLNRSRSRAVAASHAAVLSGLQGLRESTPPGARVMWVRPEYVALLGERAGVPWYFRGDRRSVALAIRDAGVDYVIVSAIYKADLAGGDGDPIARLEGITAFARPVQVILNAVTGKEEFALLKVDRALLDRALEAPGS